jgi:DNA helicase II / ATP-dependent DNA helicase PcrA
VIVGGVGFYERREVKDVLSYARAALNPPTTSPGGES